jgi:hypothetical protein
MSITHLNANFINADSLVVPDTLMDLFFNFNIALNYSQWPQRKRCHQHSPAFVSIFSLILKFLPSHTVIATTVILPKISLVFTPSDERNLIKDRCCFPVYCTDGRWLSSGFLHRVVWLKFTIVSGVLAASIIRALRETQLLRVEHVKRKWNTTGWIWGRQGNISVLNRIRTHDLAVWTVTARKAR